LINCIYGVDIQPIAIQITKLRFFISLFIDQNKDPKRDNYGISALPNLETKFVSANALVRLGKPEGQLTLFSCKNVDLENIETKLKKLRHDYFNAKSFEDKLDFQKIDRQARGAITQYLCEIGWEDHVVGLISEYDPYDQNTASSFFDPEWMFGLKGGFDILIANPPYVKEYFNRLAFDGLRDSPYYQGKMDLWYMFVSIGIDLLRFNGILTFIVQNNWVTSYGASKMRDKIMYDTQILQLVDFGEFKVFDAGIQTMVMVLKKNSTSDNYVFDYRKLHGSDNISEDLTVLLNKEDYSKAEYLTPMIVRNQFIDSTFSFSHDYIKNILDKISLLSDFKLYDNEVANGIHHHHGYIDKNRSDILEGKFKVGDGIFLLSNKEKDKLLLTNEELDLIKPSYTTKELSRWHANPINKEWVIYTDSSFKNKDKIKKYPNIKNHLDQFRKVITSDNKPYGLHRARDEYFFKGEKIIAVRKCSRPSFTYVDFDSYVSATFYIIKTERISHKYLVGILNSNLIAFWLKHKGKMQGNHYQIDKEPLINLPLIEPEQNTQFEIEKLVNIICLIANEDGYIENQSKQEMVGTYEYQIKGIVYKLYNLKQDEIAIVESSA